jgi:hypothetical protein
MFRSSALVTLSVMLLTGFDVPAQVAPSVSGSVGNAAENLIRMHEAWDSKASTPGTSLVIKESTRSGQIIKFRLIAGGVPKRGIYSLLAWPVTQKGPSEVLKGVKLDASGLAICAGTPGACGSVDKPDDPIDISVRPVPGEPVRFGLISEDGATKVFAKAVPVPLSGEDNGCRVEATLITPAAELVLIIGSGFASNSEVIMDSNSEGERHSAKGKTDADGRYISAIMPHKSGLARGVAKVSLKGAQCAPSVGVQWGRRS